MPNKWFRIVLAASVAIAAFCAIYPMYVIRPFRAQGEQELSAALLVIRLRPAVTLLCLGVAALVAIRMWAGLARRTARFAVAAAVLVTLAAAVAVRVNVFELMFHPIEHPTFAPVAEAKLDQDEKVLAVQVNGAARAYPIRAIAYHHVVNDTVGGVPLVSTY